MSSIEAPVAVAALPITGMAAVACSSDKPKPTRMSVDLRRSSANWLVASDWRFACSPMALSCSAVRFALLPISTSALSNFLAASMGAWEAL